MSSTSALAPTAAQLIRQSLVWESAVGWTPECLAEGPSMLQRFHASGFSFVSLTIGADWDRPEPALRHFARQRRWLELQPDLRVVESVQDVRRAKVDGKLGVGFHLQGAGPLGHEPALLAFWYRLGCAGSFPPTTPAIPWVMAAMNRVMPVCRCWGAPSSPRPTASA